MSRVFRTYRTTASSIIALLVMSVMLPVARQACALGLMALLDCCHDETTALPMAEAVPNSMPDCHGEVPAQEADPVPPLPGTDVDCCTVAVAPVASPPLLPTPPEAPAVQAVPVRTLAATALRLAPSVPAPPPRDALPLASPPARILYGAFLN
ncbi:MAG: hypothetical protein AAGJ10_08800 [Bacteroidota bacterium]